MRRMSPPHAGQCRGYASPARAISLAHAIREVSWERGLAVPDGECRDGPPGRVMCCKHAVMPVPVLGFHLASPVPVPEPGTWLLILPAVAWGWRRRHASRA